MKAFPLYALHGAGTQKHWNILKSLCLEWMIIQWMQETEIGNWILMLVYANIIDKLETRYSITQTLRLKLVNETLL